MYLSSKEEKMYNGEYGDTVRKSMEILIALGDIYEAEHLVDISSAQISGVSYKTIGDAGLEYLEDLATDKNAKAKVPSTLNPAGTDLDNWEELGFPIEFVNKQNRIVDSYGALGISKTCTCTPYLVGNVPRFKDHVAWSESSAVAYLNSVIGARTNREGGPGALAAAICGKTPMYAYHLEENRKATHAIKL
jgi:predicted aconitase